MTCKNCNKGLDIKSDFCNHCGAKVIRNRLTIKNLFQNFSETFLNYDNKLLQTFITLFSKPELVISGYIDGVRKKYVNVISYYAIAITFSGLQFFFLKKFFPEVLDFSSIARKGTEEISKNIFDLTQEYQSIAMMLNVPIYALMSRIVFIKEKVRNYNYTEHLVMFMYILAQLSISGAIVFIICGSLGYTLGSISLIFAPVQIVYSSYCLIRIFKLNLANFLIRLLILVVVVLILGFISTIVFLAYIYFTDGFEAFIEAQKAASGS